MNLLDDLLSRDPHRIWSASCAIRTLRDRQTLTVLAQGLEQIKTHTKGIDLGGALRPNSSHLAFAIQKLEFIRSETVCLCSLYPLIDLYSPIAEEKDGNIQIESTNLFAGDGQWVDFYLCTCTSCKARFRVEEREYHYTWWAWQRA
jgi:hypothetical protein